MPESFVVLMSAALDTMPNGKVAARGRLRPDTLQALQSGTYQREIIARRKKIDGITQCLEEGTITDVVLGMRGDKYNVLTDGAIELVNPTFIIDGQQRVNAALTWMRKVLTASPSFGALVYFNTTEAFERELFQKLNTKGTRVSPSVLLRNMQNDLAVIRALLALSKEKDFVLGNRVSWEQSPHHDHLLTGRVLVFTVGLLYTHLGPMRTFQIEDMSRSLQNIHDRIGSELFIANTRTFFSLIDECWGLRSVAYREGASYIKGNFLASLAAVLSDHPDFWEGNQLVIPKHIRSKLKSFPISDPQVVRFAGAGTQARGWLSDKMVLHLNSGKRTRRIVSRYMSSGSPSQPAADEQALSDQKTETTGLPPGSPTT